LKLGILINEGPYQHQASDTALQYVKAAIEKGHEIYRVFFYNDGVNNATRLATPPQDDIDLVVCVAAAQRRGILDKGEAERNGKDSDNIEEGFRISGLGQLVEAGIQSDRLITFGD
jgi:tRNA 2-thiouridine synthesizing protein D